MPIDDEILAITAGYVRAQHWEIVYHDLVDLYGPKIGIDGVGLWVTYKRFVQRNQTHVLHKRAWPSHRMRLAPLYKIGPDRLHNIRRRLQDAKLIEALTGQEFAKRTQEQYEHQLLNWQLDGKPREAVRPITLSDLASLGIKNPAASLIIEVHEPLPILAFCSEFGLTVSPQITAYTDDGPIWEMVFDDGYPGFIRGPSRQMAAARWIEDNLSISPEDRAHQPLVTEVQIYSLLRCAPDDKQTVVVRDHLLQRRARIAAGETPELPEPLPEQTYGLPDEVIEDLERIGWAGATTEVVAHFRQDPDRVLGWLNYWLKQAGEAHNPAGAFRECLRSGREAPEDLSLSSYVTRRRDYLGQFGDLIKH